MADRAANSPFAPKAVVVAYDKSRNKVHVGPPRTLAEGMPFSDMPVDIRNVLKDAADDRQPDRRRTNGMAGGLSAIDRGYRCRSRTVSSIAGRR